MILIVDYGMANLRSVQKAFEKVGAAAEISGDPDRIGAADKLVLPGVGAFRDAIARLNEAHLADPIRDHIRRGRPFFGICLGLQLLFTTGYEDGVYTGLDVFPGDVVRFGQVQGLKVPHMGWNEIVPTRPSPILAGLGARPYLYFAHSYYAPVVEATVATCAYGTDYTAVLHQGNVFGVQFHPEKSGPLGLRIVRNFVEL